MEKRRKVEVSDPSYLRHACQVCSLAGPDAMCPTCEIQRQKKLDDPSNLFCRVCSKQFTAIGYMKQHLVSPVHKGKLDKLAMMQGRGAPPAPEIFTRGPSRYTRPAVARPRPARAARSESSDGEASYESNSEGEEAQSMPCEICGGDGPEDDGVICDSCEKSYHFTCLDPPMQSVPAGKWLCAACEADGADAEGPLRRPRRPNNALELSPESEFLLEVYRKLLARLAECSDGMSTVTSAHIQACTPASLLGLSLDQLARPPWAERLGASMGVDPTMTEAQLAAALHQMKADESQLSQQLAAESQALYAALAVASADGHREPAA